MASWKGAIKLGSFNLHVRLESRVRTKSGESWKTLAPDGLPPISKRYDQAGNELDSSQMQKGVEVSKGEFAALTPDALELIDSMEKSTVVEPKQFCPVSEIPLELAQKTYVVVPDKDVAGADDDVNVLWNGLRASKLAYVTQISKLAGARDSVVAVYATSEGLYAVALPFGEEMFETPIHEFKVDKKAAALFEQFVEQNYADRVGTFDLDEHESEWRKSRTSAIEMALSGESVKAPEAPEKPTTETPNLMAALEGAVKEAGSKKAAAKKPAAKKSTKKAKVKA